MTAARIGRTLLAIVVAVGMAAAQVHAGQGQDKNKNKNESKPGKTAGQGQTGGATGSADALRVLVTASISVERARELAVAHRYTGYDPLPPGIRKNLARGKPLPPGIAKRFVPQPMLEELPPHPGYEWRVYGHDLVLVQLATQIIADVLARVFE